MISAGRILPVFLWIALTAFGGSQSAAIQREVVRTHKWLSLEEFMTLRGLALVTPGPNSPNLAILVGQRLGGTPGAFVAYLAASLPGIIITLILGALSLDPHNHLVSAALRGITAACVGLVGSNALEMTLIYRKQLLPMVLMAVTLFAVVFAHFSLWLTLAVFLPISIVVMRRQARILE